MVEDVIKKRKTKTKRKRRTISRVPVVTKFADGHVETGNSTIEVAVNELHNKEQAVEEALAAVPQNGYKEVTERLDRLIAGVVTIEDRLNKVESADPAETLTPEFERFKRRQLITIGIAFIAGLIAMQAGAMVASLLVKYFGYYGG